MRILACIGALALFQASCDVASTSKKKLTPSAANAVPEEATFRLKLDGVAHLFTSKSDGEETLRLAGVDALGIPLYRNVVSPSSLVVESFSHLIEQKFLVLKFAALKEVDIKAVKGKNPYELSSGEDIFADCGGHIVYSIADESSECFDKSEYPAGQSATYKLLDASAIDRTSLFAVRTISDEAGKSNVELVRRISKTSFYVETRAIFKPGMEFLAQTKLGLMTKETSEEGVVEFFVSTSNEKNYTRTKLDFLKLMGEVNGCFYYLKTDGKTMGIFCPLPNTVIDILVALLPDGYTAASPVKTVQDMGDGNHLVLNVRGEGFIVRNNSECCTLRVFEDMTDPVQVLVAGNALYYTELSGKGVNFVDIRTNDKRLYLEEFDVRSINFSRSKDRLIFTGFDPNKKFVSGSVGLDGSDRKFNDL